MRTILLCAALALLCVACTPRAATDTASSDSASEGPVRVAMTVTEYEFSPSEVTVPHGRQVELTVTNAGERTHGLGIPALNVNDVIEPGQTKTITFSADAPGSYSFLCTVPCGSGHTDMHGSIIVT